jgi:hypothetical protein
MTVLDTIASAVGTAAALVSLVAAVIAWGAAIRSARHEAFSNHLIGHAVRRLPAAWRERYREEWTSELESIPGRLAKLLFAVQLWFVAGRIARNWADASSPWWLRRSVRPARALLGLAALLLPTAHRARYLREWKAELRVEQRRHDVRGMVGFVLRTLRTAPNTARSLRGLPPWSSILHRLRRLEPVGVGLLAGLGTVATFMSLRPKGSSPTRQQLIWVLLAAVTAGTLAGWKWHKDHPYRPNEDDLEAYEDDDPPPSAPTGSARR